MANSSITLLKHHGNGGRLGCQLINIFRNNPHLWLIVFWLRLSRSVRSRASIDLAVHVAQRGCSFGVIGTVRLEWTVQIFEQIQGQKPKPHMYSRPSRPRSPRLCLARGGDGGGSAMYRQQRKCDATPAAGVQCRRRFPSSRLSSPDDVLPFFPLFH